jgi:hypothetical protein
MDASRTSFRITPAVWVQPLAVLVAVRVLIPLITLAAAPARVPLLPPYEYVPLNGDAYGSYHAVVNLYAAFSAIMIGWIGLGTLVLLACFTVAGVLLWRAGIRWAAVLVPALGVSLALGYLAREAAGSEAGVIGWPLAWAASLLPLPLLRIGLTPDLAFAFGFALSLLANAVTVVATAVLGFRATGRRSVGLLAAGAYATWPLWVGIVAGSRAWENGQWAVDVGLQLYSEPLSTALVVTALAVLLGPRLPATSAAVAGLLLGLAVTVKLPNGPIAAVVVVLVAVQHGTRKALVVVCGGLVALPILVGFWPNGYVSSAGGVDLGALYRWSYIAANARTSTVFTPLMLLVLVPLACVGLVAVRGWFPRLMLVGPVLATVACFGAYYVTNQHPRFYFVVLPSVFVLQAAGAVLFWQRIRAPRVTPAARPG